MDYALRHQHSVHLKAIIVSNMTASVGSFLRHVAKWKETLSPDLLQKVDDIESTEDWENPEYERIMMEVIYPQTICRIQPWPEPLTRAFRLANQPIYIQMQGHSEFVVTGNLKGWDAWDRLSNIKQRTLFIGAEYDEMDPKDMERMAAKVPKAEATVCPGGGHMSFYDSQSHYFQHLLAFLKAL